MTFLSIFSLMVILLVVFPFTLTLFAEDKNKVSVYVGGIFFPLLSWILSSIFLNGFFHIDTTLHSHSLFILSLMGFFIFQLIYIFMLQHKKII